MKKFQHRRLEKRKKEQAKARRSTGHPVMDSGTLDQALSQEVYDFAMRRLSGPEAERAARQYFGSRNVESSDPEEEQGRVMNFQEWLLNDYRMTDHRRVMECFAMEEGPRLSPVQRALVDAWLRTRHLRLFEVQDVERGRGVRVQDLLTEEIFEIEDRTLSMTAPKWIIFLARMYQASDRMCLTGQPLAVSPMEKGRVVTFVRDKWEAYKAIHIDATYTDFYRENTRLLELWFENARLKAEVPRVAITDEGHEIVLSKARFRLLDVNAVSTALGTSKEFRQSGPYSPEIGLVPIVWVDTGRSRVPKSATSPEHGVIAQSHFMPNGPDHPEDRLLTLGDLTLQLLDATLEISCISRERLKACKALLKEMCGAALRQVGKDTFEKFDARSPHRAAADEEFPHAIQLPKAERERIIRHLSMQWLDAPVPALDNRTPREAMKTPHGREQLRELFKYMEYMDERAGLTEETMTMDLEMLRQELGLKKE
jgi:hypothetical protein